MALFFLACLPWLFSLCLLGSSALHQEITTLPRFSGYGEAARTYNIYSHPTSRGIFNRSLSCEEDLAGSGSFDSICTVMEDVYLEDDSFIIGQGSLIVAENATIQCPIRGCIIEINLSGDVYLESGSSLIAGTIVVDADTVRLEEGSSMNVTSLAGPPPPQTSGTPLGLDGAGGGYGGRGAFCVKSDGKDQEDAWGGDVYSWSSLSAPWSYGSQGGTTSREEELGGGGGGRIFIACKWLYLNGTVLADGGYAGSDGGGGSGGSIRVQASVLNGTGEISASGGTGWAGGGGGRVAIESVEQDGIVVSVHGGNSLGCPYNAGAAGTRFDLAQQTLIVSNKNRSTQTDTLLMEFPTYPLWENVYIENHAKVAIPLLWSRVQVRGQISLKRHGTLSSGLAHYPFSEFELVADEVELINSTIKVYGALRLSVKVLQMWNSTLRIDGGGGMMVATSTIDASNFIFLMKESMISSNSNLGIHGQGFFKLKGQGDTIIAQRLFISLFYNVNVGPKAVLQAPLDQDNAKSEVVALCGSETCPMEITQPPEDCNLNVSLPFTLQICRVEDVNVEGVVRGTIIHIHRARTVTVNKGGLITASAQGCRGGIGNGSLSKAGAIGGAGHGGQGGKGYFNGSWAGGGKEYGSTALPCELGSGSGNFSSDKFTVGGGVIVIGSLEHALSSLDILGSVTSDGQSYHSGSSSSEGGVGGGSGGTLLFFLQTLILRNGSLLSTVGGSGSSVGGGGGGGGRIHFHWSNIAVGEDFIPIASVKGSISMSGGLGSDKAIAGENGTLTGRNCPPGLFGVFCKECPIGTYKDEDGSDHALCKPCSLDNLPQRAYFTYVRGGVTFSNCPYKCVSDKYRMPYCYTPLQELIHTFGGPWIFGLILVGLSILLALVLSLARVKLIGMDDFSGPMAVPRGSQIDHSLPFLESLNEVLETTRVEESQNHVHRLYFLGSNSFKEPWHLPHMPPKQIVELIYEDAFNRFVDEINSQAAYQWWEGAIHGILAISAYPLAYIWKQWCRRRKVQQLREYVRSGYDHSCLRSCRSRALYEGLKVAATPDLMLAYIDFFLGGDEKRSDLPPGLSQRLPLSIIFGGNGSYMAMYYLHSDNLLTSILSQAVPSTIWYRMVAGLNAQLRTVRRDCLRTTLLPVIDWLGTHANPYLLSKGICVDLAWFQTSTSQHFQLGLVVNATNDHLEHDLPLDKSFDFVARKNRTNNGHIHQPLLGETYQDARSDALVKKLGGDIIDRSTIKTVVSRKVLFFPISVILCNVRPFGQQDFVGLVISILLLGDFSLTLLTLLQFYSISILAFLTVLLILPLASLIPFFTGIFALFSHGPQKSADHARIYALWNATSLVNTIVALLVGLFHYKFQAPSNDDFNNTVHSINFTTEEGGWWMFPSALFICKIIQARMLDRHIANLEVRNRRLYSKDPAKFWDS